MHFSAVKVKTRIFFLLCVIFTIGTVRGEEYSVDGTYNDLEVIPLDHSRSRRDVPTAKVPIRPKLAGALITALAAVNPSRLIVDDNKTPKLPDKSVTQVPLFKKDKVNGTANTPKVSEPILPDDNFTSFFHETPESIKAEHNITNLKYNDHGFYNSVFIGNVEYFKEHWQNITKPKPEVHPILSNSHRRATSQNISFEFPFYGHGLRNVTVATGGFLYTGEHAHNWLAATQYIAPLMANFDTTMTNDSAIKIYKDEEKFTALWENVTLQEDKKRSFTFAATLYKNGDIVFAYKNIPKPIESINDTEHPVKVGISDAYLTDNILFYVRRKTIYEYHRVSFKNYEITNNTILKLTALPTCIQYNTCNSCVNHETGFNCSWCEKIKKCSSGTDRNKQDWTMRDCEKSQTTRADQCPAGVGHANATNTAYVTDVHPLPAHDSDIRTVDDAHARKDGVNVNSNRVPNTEKLVDHHSAIGGVMALLFVFVFVASVVGWAFYAFKNPHTRSGQILIKYRPSQWNWRRGEARYTAATIHM